MDIFKERTFKLKTFYVQSYKKRRNESSYRWKEGEFFVLTEDNWNDYTYETTFYLDFWKNNKLFEIGLIRILHYSHPITRNIISSSFDALNQEYISLGYNEEFYKNLIDILGLQHSKEILEKLNDICIINLENNEYFTLDHEGIQNSFFRSSEGRYLFSEVNNKYFLHQESSDREYDFIFKAKLDDNSESYTNIEINFTQQNYLPHRLFTIVGKNGVGKTRLLNQLAEALYDSSNIKSKNRFEITKKSGNSELDSKIPIYKNVIAISFSVFDKFFKGKESDKKEWEKPLEDEELTKFNNYTYIGLHKIDNSVYTSEELIEINKREYQKLISKNREGLFLDIINSSNILNFYIEKQDFDEKYFFEEIFSSGQSVFISMLCRLLSEIEEGSLIFLDEPELYLHPNAIANLARIFYDILEKFKSYAILCTHSPILVQEIPSKYVRKLTLIDQNTTHYSMPSLETFGANISEITADIFNVLDTESNYKTQIVKWSEEFSEEEILNFFDEKLSLKTQLFISSLYPEN